MPLTPFQGRILSLLATNRSEDSYLAGGAALHITPRSKRYSNDLDYFHDSEEGPPEELGCLYYSLSKHEFVSDFASGDPDIVAHYGRPGGVLPEVHD